MLEAIHAKQGSEPLGLRRRFDRIRFAHDLRPAILDDVGLIPALHAYSKGLATRKKLKIQLTAFDWVEALGGAKRTVMFRVAQEALTNVARHARATKVGFEHH